MHHIYLLRNDFVLLGLGRCASTIQIWPFKPKNGRLVVSCLEESAEIGKDGEESLGFQLDLGQIT